ncbi:MAG: hypothetical protein HY555_02955 [Euryarchaeota archaeon]|nr:hypothetical protein [Euryarchaeota archaeon]
MVSDDLQMEILRAFYEHNKVKPNFYRPGDNLSEALGVPKDTIIANVRRLEEKGLLEVRRSVGGKFIAKITPAGIEAAGSPKNAPRAPAPSAAKAGPPPALRVVAVPKGEKEMQRPEVQAFISFGTVMVQIEKMEMRDAAARERLITQVREIEGEFAKEEPSFRKVKVLLESIRSSAPWAAPILTDAIVGATKLYLKR